MEGQGISYNDTKKTISGILKGNSQREKIDTANLVHIR